MTSSDRPSWASSALWGIVVAVAGGTLALLLSVIVDSIRNNEVESHMRDARIRALEIEHQPWRRHMGGAGVVPRYDHPGRNVEIPTAPKSGR